MVISLCTMTRIGGQEEDTEDEKSEGGMILLTFVQHSIQSDHQLFVVDRGRHFVRAPVLFIRALCVGQNPKSKSKVFS